MIELVGKENVKLNKKQIDEIIDLISKEELIELEEQIEKALEKNQEQVVQKQEKASAHVTEEKKVDTAPGVPGPAAMSAAPPVEKKDNSKAL